MKWKVEYKNGRNGVERLFPTREAALAWAETAMDLGFYVRIGEVRADA